MTTLLAPDTANTSAATEVAPTQSGYTLHPDERLSHMLHIDEAELSRLRAILKEQITFMWASRNANPFVRPMLKQVVHLALAARDAWEITADISECLRYRRRQISTAQA
jgi:hypothetical protein